MGKVSISYSIKQSSSLQVVRDYINTSWHFTSKVRVALQRHMSINLDLFNPIRTISATSLPSGGSGRINGKFQKNTFSWVLILLLPVPVAVTHSDHCGACFSVQTALSMPGQMGGAPPCEVCEKRVYFNEEKTFMSRTWHKKCFRCSKWSKPLCVFVWVWVIYYLLLFYARATIFQLYHGNDITRCHNQLSYLPTPEGEINRGEIERGPPNNTLQYVFST